MIWPTAQHNDPARNSTARVIGALTGRTGRAQPGARPGRPTTRHGRRTSGSGRPRTLFGQPGRSAPPTFMGGGMDPLHMESITAGGGCAVLRIDGDIDAYAAPQLRDRVTGLAGHGTVHIIADL